MRKKTLAIMVGALLLAGLLAVGLMGGCGSSTTTTKPLTLEKGVLKVGSDTTYPPFEFKKDGKPTGFDYDIANEIAKKLGLKLDFMTVEWTGIVPGLKTDKYDTIMSSLTITPERKKEIDFSIPYFDSNQALSVAKDSTIKSTDDLKGKVVGVQIDTTDQFTAEELQKEKGISEIRKFDTITLAFEDLNAGRIDAIINDYGVNHYEEVTNGKSKVVQIIPTNEQYGIGIKKGNTALKTKIDAALKEIINSPVYDQIYEKWLGKKPDKKPATQ